MDQNIKATILRAMMARVVKVKRILMKLTFTAYLTQIVICSRSAPSLASRCSLKFVPRAASLSKMRFKYIKTWKWRNIWNRRIRKIIHDTSSVHWVKVSKRSRNDKIAIQKKLRKNLLIEILMWILSKILSCSYFWTNKTLKDGLKNSKINWNCNPFNSWGSIT